MKHLLIFTAFFFMLLTSASWAHDQSRTRVPIDHVLSAYAELHAVKFVIDVRVKGFIDIVDIEIDQITQSH